MELTIEAIEGDLSRAEANSGRPVMHVYLTTAQIRATLMNQPSRDIQIEQAPSGDTFTVPADAVWADRVEAAAHALGWPTDRLADILKPFDDPEPYLQGLSAPVVIDVDDDEGDVDDDFFAEARKARKS